MGEKILTFLGRSETWIVGAALVVFLVVTWVLRGASVLQAAAAEEDADAPRAGYRDRIVAGVVVGLMLILGAAYVALGRGIPLSIPIFAMGFGLVLTLIRVNRRYRHASPSLRRTIDFSDTFLNTSLLAGVLIVCNVLAFRYGSQPIDMTREGTYSLSSLTLNQLKSLDRPLTFTIIFGHGPLATSQRDRVEQLLEAYRDANPQKVRIERLDPYTELSRVEELAKRVPDLAMMRGGGVLLEYGEGTEAAVVVVRNQEMFVPISVDQLRAGTDRFASTFTGEDAITSAVMRIREGKNLKVAFTKGHGEPRTDDPSAKGLGNWKVRLSRVGCAVIDLNLAEEDVPDDLTLLIVVGPVDPFKSKEVEKLRSYAGRGGPLLLLLGNAGPTGLEEFLKSYNLEILPGIVVDPRLNYEGRIQVVYAPTRETVPHPISSAMDPNRYVMLDSAAPIRILGETGPDGVRTDPVDRSLVPTVILQASRYAWGETDLKNPRPNFDKSVDVPTPRLGVAVSHRAAPGRPGEAPEEKPRLVLLSCPKMAENFYPDRAPSNLDLLMNAASWLRGRPETLGIAPKTHVALTLAVDDALRSRLIMVPSATAVMLIIAMGIIVYIARRE
ncbi:MAG: Gldg family protein [Isosphaeraceae bacterium]